MRDKLQEPSVQHIRLVAHSSQLVTKKNEETIYKRQNGRPHRDGHFAY